MENITIRHAETQDLESIVNIYNEAVSERKYTFDAFYISSERYRNILEKDSRSFILIAEIKQLVIGWVSVVPVSNRWAYRFTGIDSMFVLRNYRGKRIGCVLREAELKEAKRVGYHSILGEVLSSNKSTIAFNIKYGYQIVGEIKEAGFRDGKWINLIIMQKTIRSENQMMRRFRFTIITDDFMRSVALYKDVLGLEMRLLSYPIAMFPFGEAEYEVCERTNAEQFLGLKGEELGKANAIITLMVETENEVNSIVKAAIEHGAIEIENYGLGPKVRSLKDFNGLIINIEFKQEY